MISRILERLEEEKSDWNCDYNAPINIAIEIVQEVAKDGGWISVEERLPEIWEDVLLWCKGYFICGTHIGEECQCYGIGYKLPGNDWDVAVLKALNEDNIAVLAWQPLPAPFKKGE